MSQEKNSLISKSLQFVKHDVWHINLKEKSKRISFLVKFARILILAARGFKQDKCIEKASALTYYSLLSIVPIVAMALGFAKGFGFDSNLQDYLRDYLSDNKEVLDQVLSFSESLLAKTQKGIVAGIGFILLVWSVIKVLGNIEGAFNQIWSVNKQRSFVRKISDYMTIMIFAPILLIISTSATNSISDSILEMAQNSEFVSRFKDIIEFALKLLPYSLIWIAFAFLYVILPNTRVSFKSALVGGIVAGIIFQITQHVYISFQVGVSSYNAIYGSFAALPLFLVLMQTTWIIVLLGAEIAYARQNIQNFEAEIETQNLSVSLRERLGILILNTIVTRFGNGEKALSSTELSEELGIPHRITKHIVILLVEAKLIHETKTDNEKEFAFTPAISIEKLSVGLALDKLRSSGTNEYKFTNSKVFSRITYDLIDIDSNKSMLIKNI